MAELRLGADAKHPNPGYMNLLQEMGYPFDKASSALMAVKNESLDAAIDWLDKVFGKAFSLFSLFFTDFFFFCPLQNRDELDAALVLQQEHRPSLGPSVVSSAPSSAPTPEFDADVRADGLSRSKLEAERKAHADFKRQKQMQEERELLKKKEQDAKIVREKYAKEKAEKAAAAAARKNPAAAAVPKDAQPPAAAAAPKVASGNTAAVIQVRLPNRPAIVVQGLTAGSSLLELYARVDAECGRVDYVLTQPFPPPVTHFSREDKRTLGETGLAPRAALTVTDLASLGKGLVEKKKKKKKRTCFDFKFLQ